MSTVSGSTGSTGPMRPTGPMQRNAPTGAGDPAAAPGGASGSAPSAEGIVWPDVAVLVLVQVPPRQKLWLFSRLVRGGQPLRGEAGLRFARVLGSGHDGGFGPRPGFDRGGLFALFDGEAQARRFVESSPVVAAYRRHASEMLVAVLRASSVRGSWGGMSMRVTATAEPGAPVASLTRASIRPRRALEFWRHAAPSQDALADAEGCRLLAGLGEAPLLRQATFSLWRDTVAMDAYARRGPHQAAVRSAWGRQFFSESMFVRFVPLRLQGRWQGRDHDLAGAAGG